MMLTRQGNALNLMRAMLAHEPQTRIIVVTGLAGDDGRVREAIMLGAFAHLQKPVYLDQVKALLFRIAEDSGRLHRVR